MRCTYFALVGALSLSGVSASASAQLFANSVLGYSAPERIETRNVTSANLLARFLGGLSPRQAAGRCGAEFSGARCGGNQCCSSYGYCGTDFEHCAELVGCQPQYGRCGEAPPEPSQPPVTSTPTPTPSSSSVRPPSSSSAVPSSSSVQPPLPSGSLIVSSNGQCGNSTTCGGSPFGNCCSEWYFCGNSAAYCGTGCRSAFGTCGGGQPPVSSSSPAPSSTPAPPSSAPPSSAPPSSTPTPSRSSTPTPTPSSTAQPVPTNVSTDGQCGANGKTCQGSTFGRCCSDYGWCGNQQEYCSTGWGCQPQFGTCG